MTRIKNMKGFTLIELVVVIVIIGILAAVAAFAYTSIVSNANERSALAVADQFNKSYQASLAIENTASDAFTDAASDALASGVTVADDNGARGEFTSNGLTVCVTYPTSAANSGSAVATACP